MNLILFEQRLTRYVLSVGDPRFDHARSVLRLKEGDHCDIGVINGPRGKGRVLGIDEVVVVLEPEWGQTPPPLAPLTLLIGLPRPQTAKKVLQECTSLGVGRLGFFHAAKGDPGYARSSLWTEGEWRASCLLGAEQAFCTHLPEVWHGGDLEAGLAWAGLAAAPRVALDVYEGVAPLGSLPAALQGPVALALGPERGWSNPERALLRAAGWELRHLGQRVLRVETAATVAAGLILERLGALGRA